MCWALYLASDFEIPRIPWDDTTRRLALLPLAASNDVILAKFSVPNVAYVCSHNGCGCGFMDDSESCGDGLRQRLSVLGELHELLASMRGLGAKIEMFLCWEGDQGRPIGAEITLSPGDFLHSPFPLEAQQFAVIQ